MAQFTALVVDDVRDNREILRSGLELAGYVVDEAIDGQKALDFLAESQVNLLVLDLGMPNMDGVTVIRALRKDPRHSNMRILVATANPDMLDDGVDLLVDYMIEKPFEMSDYLDIANRLKESF